MQTELSIIFPGKDIVSVFAIHEAEKQEKVNGNLLMWFKAKLNMLSEEEKGRREACQRYGRGSRSV